MKNYSGTLIFDTEFNQLIRQNADGVENTFKDPIEQVEHQQFQLTQWLERNKIPSNPVHSYVVIANDSAKIVSKKNDRLSNKLIRNTKLIPTIKRLREFRGTEILSKNDLRRLSKLLLKHHTPSNPDILNQFQINEEEILIGVRCPYCSNLPMERKHGNWICRACTLTSKNAHINTLEDYDLLISPFITNQQFRDFFIMKSISTSHRLLSELNLQHTGTTKSRVYDLTSLWNEEIQ